jgi:hypothetical protein
MYERVLSTSNNPALIEDWQIHLRGVQAKFAESVLMRKDTNERYRCLIVIFGSGEALLDSIECNVIAPGVCAHP